MLLQMDAVESVHTDDPFILISDLVNSSPWPVCVRTSTFQLVTKPFISKYNYMYMYRMY